MKTTHTILWLATAAVIVAGAALTWTLNRPNASVSAEIVLGVDQVAQDPEAFAGREVRLTGVVSAVVPEQQRFAVIDRAEYTDCEVVTCSQYQIPIAYDGDLPVVEAFVTITGRLIEAEPGRYLVQATAFELSP